MLLCGIIDELKKSTTNILSFFFCEAADSRINNATAVLRGLIYLLMKQHDSLVSDVRDNAGGKPFEGENAWWALLNIFDSIISRYCGPKSVETFVTVPRIAMCNKLANAWRENRKNHPPLHSKSDIAEATLKISNFTQQNSSIATTNFLKLYILILIPS